MCMFSYQFTYHADVASGRMDSDIQEHAVTNKRQVIQFVWGWCQTIGEAFWEDKTILAFLEVNRLS